MVVKFHHANSDHKDLMVGKVLEQQNGIIHQLFKESEEEEPADPEGEDAPQKPEQQSILKRMKHIYIKEVVEDKQIHFWKVPRLGSFLAVPLIYKSCLSEESLDEAIADWIEKLKKIEEQEKLKQEWQEEQDQIKEEKARENQPYEPEKKEWEDYKPAPFKTVEKKYVICIDTLG